MKNTVSILCIFCTILVADSIELNSTVLESKLLNGKPIPYDYTLPIASLRQRNQNNSMSRFCTGYFVSKYIVLTAGHCIRKIEKSLEANPNNVLVYLKWRLMQERPVRYKIRLAEHFNEFKEYDENLCDIELDIGLLLVECLDPHLNDVFIYEIPMSPHFIYPNETYKIYGWNTPSRTQNSATSLTYIEIKILPFSNCSERYQNIEKVDEEFQMCGDAINIEEKTYLGDFGSVLINKDQHIMGIVTHISGVNTTPTVFARVNHIAKIFNAWKDSLMYQQFCEMPPALRLAFNI